jgi:hypothetical protein
MFQDAGKKAQGMGSAQHETSLMHRVCIICVICALICYTPNSCNRELCLTVSTCYRRINHMAVKKHVHSSSGVREVVPGTVSVNTVSKINKKFKET